jgi:HEXXH motif-containing protein
MLGRLLEVDRVTASQFLQRIKAVSDAILVYVYPDRAEVPLRSLAQSMGLRLHDSPHLAVALLNTRDADEVIDWLRLAEPQSDQYDTNIILRLASMGTTAGRPQPYRRAPVGDFPLIFDDQVAVRPVYRGMAEFGALSEHYLDAPLDHPNIATATQYVRRWPAMYEQCKRLLEAVHPAIDARIPFESDEIYRGSTCHSFERLFGTLWSTIHCPIGLAEAMVHELAHQKLRALGVSFESATAIVANDPAELHVSPIVKDRLRPMSAVLHAQYSYVHVTALDVHIISAESDPARRARLRQVLNKNLLRIGEGRQTIQRHLVLGLHGTAFMQGFDRWTQSTMDSAAGMLGAT